MFYFQQRQNLLHTTGYVVYHTPNQWELGALKRAVNNTEHDADCSGLECKECCPMHPMSSQCGAQAQRQLYLFTFVVINKQIAIFNIICHFFMSLSSEGVNSTLLTSRQNTKQQLKNCIAQTYPSAFSDIHLPLHF